MTKQRFASEAKVRPAPEVLATAFGRETVILDLKAGTYFGLDDVGTRVWSLIQRQQTVGAIRDTILTEYDVSRSTCDADLQALLHDLVTRRLVEIADQPAGADA
jgi:hypothetical protein